MGDRLVLRDVCKRYPHTDRRVLIDVSLTLGEGEIGALVASRHEGKTTLLKIATGMVRPDRGEVLVGVEDLTRCSRKRREEMLGREILWVNRRGPGVDFKVRDYIAMPLVFGRRCGRRQRRRLAEEALDRFGLAGRARMRWDELSSSEQLLVHLARAFAAKPGLLVLDDLLDGLGARGTREAEDLLRAVVKDIGCAVLLSTEDFGTALVADRIWSLSRGRLEVTSDLIGPDADVIEFPGGLRGHRAARSAGS